MQIDSDSQRDKTFISRRRNITISWRGDPCDESPVFRRARATSNTHDSSDFKFLADLAQLSISLQFSKTESSNFVAISSFSSDTCSNSSDSIVSAPFYLCLL